MFENKMKCTECEKDFSPTQILENCDVSWPNQSWALFNCPNCNKKQHIKLLNGQIRFGFIDGAPGPCFITEKSFPVPGIVVKCDIATGINVKIGEFGKLIEKK